MISRRLLRVKALMCLYAYNRRDDGDLAKAEKELLLSLNKSYELYFYLLLLLIELADTASEKIAFALQKKMPSPEDLRPNRRFADNMLINQLRENNELRKYQSSTGLSWAAHSGVIKTLYSKLTEWDEYRKYMSGVKHGYTEDKKFLMKLISVFIPASEDLITAFEEMSIYWNDDLENIVVMTEKTLRRFSKTSGPETPLMPLFRNDEDKEFVINLFRKAILNTDKVTDLIDRNTTNWEVERIALMDRLVMQMAITEVMCFEEIPVKVTLNEYIEIAKNYCTAKSNTFVNGILDKIVREMREKKLFRKTGRGLLGEDGNNG